MISTIKILYVEDDPEWQQIIQDGISTFGYELDFALTSKDAIAKVKRTTYHIALLDKRLDEQDAENAEGLSVATVIAGLNEGTKIIVYTSYGNIDDARAAFRQIKVWDFVGKDQPITEIIHTIKKAAEEATLEFSRPSRMPMEILIAKGNAIEQFLSDLASNMTHSVNRQDLENFSKRLLGQFRPLLPDQSDAKLLTIDQSPVLQVRFWSKRLGAPIVVWFGKFDALGTVLEKIESDNVLGQSLDAKHKLVELEKHESSPALGGVVFRLKNVELEEFESQIKFAA
jgi:ActR/RegA family two-component response regulator